MENDKPFKNTVNTTNTKQEANKQTNKQINSLDTHTKQQKGTNINNKNNNNQQQSTKTIETNQQQQQQPNKVQNKLNK